MSIKNNAQFKPEHSMQWMGWKNAPVKIISGQLFWILLISGIVKWIYYSVLLTTADTDTTSYLKYHANILKGETDALRTPVYPYFIKLIGLFGQQNLNDHVVAAQCVISFLSIILFYRIVHAAFKNRVLVFAATLVYGVMLPVINFDKLVLTESLSVTCTLLFIYMLVRYLQNPGNLKAALLSLFVLITIMLRPSFIYLLPLVIVFWVLRLVIFKKDRKKCLYGLAAAVVVMILIAGYSQLNERNAGFNGVSVVSNNNQVDVIFRAGIYHYGNDPQVSAAMESNSKLKPGVKGINIMKKYNPDRMHRFIITCIKNQPVAYTRYLFTKMIDLRSANIFAMYANFNSGPLARQMDFIQKAVFHINFIFLWWFVALSFLLIIVEWISWKQTPWLSLVLWLLIAAQIAVAIAGGYSEYQRLILPAMPALVILLFYYIDRLWVVIGVEKSSLSLKFPS